MKNIKQAENTFLLRKRHHEDEPSTPNLDINNTAQYRPNIVARNVYNVETARIEKSNYPNRARQKRSPIPDKSKTDKLKPKDKSRQEKSKVPPKKIPDNLTINREKLLNARNNILNKEKLIKERILQEKLLRERNHGDKTSLEKNNLERNNIEKPILEKNNLEKINVDRQSTDKSIKEGLFSKIQKNQERIAKALDIARLQVKPVNAENEDTPSKPNVRPEKPIENNPTTTSRLTSKIKQVMNGDSNITSITPEVIEPVKHDTDMKTYIINVIRRHNTKEIKRQHAPEHETQTEKLKQRTRSNPSKVLKRTVRRQIWHWAKGAIKRNEQWSQLAADNNIMLDNINIDKFDISLIDLDALGIESKILKKSIKWLFK